MMHFIVPDLLCYELVGMLCWPVYYIAYFMSQWP